MTDDLSPIYAGDRTPWTLNQVFRVGGAARPATGISPSAIVMKLQSVDQPATIITLNSANITIPNAAGGVMTYAPAAGDVATPGTYLLWVAVPWDRTHLQHCDPYMIEIKFAP